MATRDGRVRRLPLGLDAEVTANARACGIVRHLRPAECVLCEQVQRGIVAVLSGFVCLGVELVSKPSKLFREIFIGHSPGSPADAGSPVT